jgi:hypothetical protein
MVKATTRALQGTRFFIIEEELRQGVQPFFLTEKTSTDEAHKHCFGLISCFPGNRALFQRLPQSLAIANFSAAP